MKQLSTVYLGSDKVHEITKKCTYCGEVKSIDNFTKAGSRKSLPNARKSICRQCTAKRDKERNQNKKAVVKEKSLDIFDFWVKK